MKKYLTISAIFMLMFSTYDVYAQLSDKQLAKAEQAYLFSLSLDNQGAVESAIIHIMKMKCLYPKHDYTALIEKLNEVAACAPEKITRLKAYVAGNYLKYPERFNWIRNNDYLEVESFFNRYALEVEKQVQNIQEHIVVAESK